MELALKIAQLESLSLPELQSKWNEFFETECDSNNKEFYVSRIAYRMQELELGGLSQATRKVIPTLYIDPLKQKDLCIFGNRWISIYNIVLCRWGYPCIMAQEPCFMLDNDQHFPPAPDNIITGDNLEYLLGFLCSRVCYFALRQFYMGGGIEGELKTNRLLILPIPKIFQSEKISNLVKQLINLKLENMEYSQIDFQLEEEVAKQYHLTTEEFEYIRNFIVFH